MYGTKCLWLLPVTAREVRWPKGAAEHLRRQHANAKLARIQIYISINIYINAGLRVIQVHIFEKKWYLLKMTCPRTKTPTASKAKQFTALSLFSWLNWVTAFGCNVCISVTVSQVALQQLFVSGRICSSTSEHCRAYLGREYPRVMSPDGWI